MVSSLANGESPSTVVSTPLAGAGYELINPQLIAAGTLSAVTNTTIPPQTFTVSPPITVRYLALHILGGCYATHFVGLNEIQAISQVDNTPPQVKIDNALFLNWPNPGLREALQTSSTLIAPAWSTPPSPSLAPTLINTNWGAYVLATNSAGFYHVMGN